jgi:hypothetical protein
LEYFMPRSRKTARTTVLLALGLLSLAGGCGYLAPGNPLRSNDEYNYMSTSTVPQTVVLRDLRTDEVLFTWEIPVNQKVYIRFFTDKADPKTDAAPDQCRWRYYPITMDNPPAEDHKHFSVPPSNSRRIDLFLRPSPELPGGMKPAEVPTPPDDLPPVK